MTSRVTELQPGFQYKAWFFYRMNVIVRMAYEWLGGINPVLSSECVLWGPFSSLRPPFVLQEAFACFDLLPAFVYSVALCEAYIFSHMRPVVLCPLLVKSNFEV